MMPVSDYIECPFCQGLLEPKPGKQKCPECHARFEINDRLESMFADTNDLRLPIHGTVCPSCGLVQSEGNDRCWYCGMGLCGTVQ